MKRDDTIDEIRAIRDAYAKDFDYDLDAIYQDLKRKEAARGQETVRLEPRRPQAPNSRSAA